MSRVHQDSDERHTLTMNQVGQHAVHLIPFSPAVALGDRGRGSR
jgi:hypothetical protein